MWRLWTRGFGVRDWWGWAKEQSLLWIVWKLPRPVAYWAFIRVYSTLREGPGEEFKRVCEAWNASVYNGPLR